MKNFRQKGAVGFTAFIMLTVLSVTSVFNQVPGSFNYQAVLRDASGTIRANATVSITLSILQGSAAGSEVYSETHSITTSNLGLVNLGVGSLDPSGFDAINWANGPYYIRIEVDGTEMGISQLLSVPYALYAKHADVGAETDPVFAAHPANDITTSSITNWNNAYGWGNHAGLYRPVSYVPAWGDITGKPSFAAIATSGSYADLTSTPTTLAGYGITDAMGTSHPANGISSTNISNWNTAYGWGNHASAGYAAGTHHHAASDINSGTLAVNRGGTGMASYTTGNYIRASGSTTLQQRTPAQVLGDIGAAASSHTHTDMVTGTGVSGRIVFWTGSTTVTSSSSLFWNRVTGRMGIGTNSPAFTLDVRADAGINGLRVGRGGGNIETNTAIGYTALALNTSGNQNTANGYMTLFVNSTGSYNSAFGYQALVSNTTGYNNTASGCLAMNSNTKGFDNTAAGYNALRKNTEGDKNTAFGVNALYNNTTADYNTAVGYLALEATSAFGNTAVGSSALRNNTSGYYNVAVGVEALVHSTTGDYNVAMGDEALMDNTTGNNNIALGYLSGNTTTGSNNIAIGRSAHVPSATGSNQIRMGNASITYAGIQVAWTVTSDIRWKESVRELPYGIDLVNRLKPVDYIRKNNESRTRETGFIAQDVEMLLKEAGINDYGLLSKTEEGSLELRYNDFIPILTKAIQEQQKQIEELGDEIERLRAIVSGLTQK